MQVEVTILGCGPSIGVPLIGCECRVCKSSKPHNKRSRSSILLSAQGKNLLVDFGADFRQQILRQNIRQIDAAILTHDHADHVNGIDDLKVFSRLQGRPLNLYSDAASLEAIQKHFAYMFSDIKVDPVYGKKRLEPSEVRFYDRKKIIDLDIEFFRQHHGAINSLGIKIGRFAYSIDIVKIPQQSEQYLYDLDIWVVDAMHMHDSYAHAGLETVLAWNEKFKPKQIYLTNMSHDFEYDELLASLPGNVKPAYDGLNFKLNL